MVFNREEFFRDIEQGNFDKYLKDRFTVLFYSILTRALDFKYSLAFSLPWPIFSPL